MNPSLFSQDQLPPLIVGVTGHRDLCPDDISRLTGKIQEIFADIETKFPGIPLIVMSPLAEGADRLVAHVALSRGYRLMCPLPMSRASYETDFQTEHSRREFAELLSRAEVVLEMPIVEGESPESIAQPGPGRNLQYASVGGFVAAHCEVLIALWDGKPQETTGGTSQIVDYMLTTKGIPSPSCPPRGALDGVEFGLLYHVQTPRLQGLVNAADEPYSWKILRVGNVPTVEQAVGKIKTIHHHMDRRAEGLALQTKRVQHLLSQSRDFLLSEQERKTLSQGEQSLFENFCRADALAVYFQRKTIRFLYLIFILASLATVCFSGYSDLEQPVWRKAQDNYLLCCYLAVSTTAILSFGLMVRLNYQNRFQDLRALAEGLRVQLFWRMAGLHNLVADHYLRKYRSSLDWITHTITLCYLESFRTGAAVPATSLNTVIHRWVKDQKSYFETTATRDFNRLQYLGWTAKLLFGLGLLVALVQAVLVQAFGNEPHCLFMFFMGFLPVMAGLLKFLIDKFGLDEHVQQYRRMHSVFDAADAELKQITASSGTHESRKADEAIQDILRDLGREALSENGEWLVLHRFKEMELPS